MTSLQFRVLYRQFLFRMVDLELLSANAQGDSHKLLGQFAALLLFIDLWTSLIPIHALVARTMLVVGLFAVLSWDSMFPDRRDVYVLAPLPIRARTLFLAKVAALSTALSLTVIAVDIFSGILVPFAEAHAAHGFVAATASTLRAFAAFWCTMFAAGVFIFSCVLVVQGCAAYLLPRRYFLRLSALLQLAAFCLFLSVYFLEPASATPRSLAYPTYWFTGLFHLLNGTITPALVPFARRACIALAVSIVAAGSAFLLAYFRTLRKIVEEPDIVAGTRGAHWSPAFGDPPQTALVLFTVRTLLRSRQHRIVLCFYLGIAFAVVIVLVKVPTVQQRLNIPMMISSIIVLGFAMLGTRVVFPLPRDLRANWVFRILPLGAAPQILSANRCSLLLIAAAPVCLGSAILLFFTWPWRLAAGHLIVLILLASIVADLCLYEFQKLPFACSYLPGKSNFNMAFLGFGALLFTLIVQGAKWERGALESAGAYSELFSVLCVAAFLARWRTANAARAEDAHLTFEEAGTEEISGLGLHRDGVMPVSE